MFYQQADRHKRRPDSNFYLFYSMRLRRMPYDLQCTKGLLSFFLLFASFVQTAAQQQINFTSLTATNGLSSNTVNVILQDRYGLMWFGTEDGLDKFDGSSVTVYRNKPDDDHSLQANEILSLHEDRTGNLWVGTSGGSVSMYDRQHDLFINYPSGQGANRINNNVIRGLCSDNLGRIWIASFNGVNILDPVTKKITQLLNENNTPFLKICNTLFEDEQHTIWIGTTEGLFACNPNNKTFRHFVNNPADSSSLAGNNVMGITQDKKGSIWAGTSQGLSMLKNNRAGFVNYKHAETNTSTISSNEINSILSDDDGKLWIGTERGLNMLDTRTGEINRRLYDYRDVHGLTSEGIRTVYIDNKGNYWLGTTRGGINKYDKNLNLFNLVVSNPFDKSGLVAPIVTSFAENADGSIFVGTEGGGLSLFDPGTKRFRQYTLQSKRKGAGNRLVVRALNAVNAQQLLVATISDGLFILDPATGKYKQLLQGAGAEGLNSNDIYCVKKDSKGNWWVGTNGAGINVMNANGKVVRRYTPAPVDAVDKKLPINGYIRDILEDRSGMFWIATHGGGLAQYNPLTGAFIIFNTLNSRLPNDKVQTLLQDRGGNIWAGTFGGGLCMIDSTAKQLTPFTEKNGLQNNAVYKIIEDKTGLLWISTNKGLTSIDPVSRKLHNYNYYNGVQHNNFYPGSGLLTSDGTLYFGGLEGFNYFNPAYLKKNRNVPPVLITDLKISNQSVAPSKNGVIEESVSVTKTIHLDFKQNFSLNFVALNYTAPGQNQYAYKLDGFEKDWNYVGSTAIAHYTNLDPGTYTFRVKASNNDGVWSDGNTSVKIIVHPPVWRTWYACVFYVLLLVSLIVFMRHKSIEKIKRKFTLDQEHKEAARIHEMDQLKIKFLTNLSHEFRTPISLILGPVDKLIAQEENSWSAGHLQMIKRNGKRLLHLVNQLLDFRKMEERELKLLAADGELVGFIRDSFDSFKDLAERKKITFIFTSRIAQLLTVFDHDKMERILFNLLSNAFKFTPEGGVITVLLEECTTRVQDCAATWVSIRVSDTGIGIPADKKDKIFDRFFQHSSTASVLNQGSGIGLAITKEFVLMHGGRIEVDSQPGKGTSFHVYLPFIPKPPEAVNANADIIQEKCTPEAVAVEHDVPGTKSAAADSSVLPSILLVEDNDDFRFYLKENLRQFYQVLEAINGKEGWQKALAHHPQLIVSDISMPVMDGIELCKKLKADKRTNHIPVILLTALTGEQEQLKGLKTGANDYITKPFNFELLHSKMQNLLLLQDTFKNTYTRKIDVALPALAVQQPEDEKLLSNLLLYLEEHIADPQVSVDGLSRQLGMSRSTLYHKLFALTGKTPVEYIRSVKLEKAAALLKNGDLNVSQVAYSVGFATPKYFAKTFKAKYNMLPSEYIIKMRTTSAPKSGTDK